MDDFEFHGGGLYGVEVDDVGSTFERAILSGVLDFCPITRSCFVVEFPAVGHSTTTPRAIVKPEDGGGADGLCLFEVVL